MMNNLVSLLRPTNVLLHDIAVFINFATINFDCFVLVHINLLVQHAPQRFLEQVRYAAPAAIYYATCL